MKIRIFGMASDRKRILDIMYNYSDQVTTHIFKCIVYTSAHQDYNHWISEISNWLSTINALNPKRGFTIKPKDYIDNLFIGVGDELRDAKLELIVFRDRFVPDYPDFEITYDLYKKLFDAYWEIANFFSHTLGKYEETIAKDKIIYDLHTILDKYC